MNLSSARPSDMKFASLFGRVKSRPGLAFGLIIVTALLFFELFNYSTTDYALSDLLGGLEFAGLKWSTILAIAFCGIDFAGIARLFTPEMNNDEPKEVWYLFAAWLLAATMNAILTWWGVSLAIANHAIQSTAVVSSDTLTKIVPIFVAIMVWVIRILIIGTISATGDRLIWGSAKRSAGASRVRSSAAATLTPLVSSSHSSPTPVSPRPISARPAVNIEASPARPEPTYHQLGAAPRPVANRGANPESQSTSRRF